MTGRNCFAFYLRVPFRFANPPFNVADWSGQWLENGVRWRFGKPPGGNYALIRFRLVVLPTHVDSILPSIEVRSHTIRDERSLEF